MSSSTYSYSAVLTDLESDATAIGGGGLSSAQAKSLKTLLQNVASSDGTTSYVYSILDHVVASGGTVGTSQTAFNGLINQWFLGTDDPNPLVGSLMVSNTGASLFPADMAAAYQDVNQGYYNGDCWLVASLIETAAVNPSELTSMISENANGTYGVRFCSATGYEYLTVNADLMSNQEGAYSSDGSIWAGLLEKAFVEAQANGLSFPMSDLTTFSGNYPNDYNDVSNGGWDEMMKAITGRATNYYQLNSETALAANGTVFTEILYDIQNGIDVLFDSNSDTSYGLVSDHMFAVIGVDQTTGDYIFFNPWGYANVTSPQFEVTPQELYALYTGGAGDEFLAASGAYYFNETTVCHLAGTRILTPAGERAIESLRRGDEVVTRFGGTQRIKWIGEQHYDGRFIAKNRDKLPVKIARGALGNDLPRRDLYLSPGHSVLLDEVLVLARELVNGVTVTQGAVAGVVSYYNIELAAHDCVLAEGSWSETYADCGELRGCFHNAASYWALYPREAAPVEPVLCAPRPRWGAVFTAAVARVLSPAEARSKAGATRGYVEQVGDEVTGWAFDPENPELPVRLHVYAGGELVGMCFAHEERVDVREAGFGAGRSGFRCVLPAGVDPAGVVVRRAASREILPRAEAALELAIAI